MSGAIILLYHRVTELATDPQLLAVSPERFAQHMRWLRETGRPLALGELGGKTSGAAVTFDDGYADNFQNAMPILRDAGVPATFFVAGDATERRDEFFWDELDRILLQPGLIPASIRLNIGPHIYESELGADADYRPEQWHKYRSWNVLREDDPTARQRIYRELCRLLHRSTVARRTGALSRLREWAGRDRAVRPSHRMMSADQLRQLASDPQFEIGGHTINHPLLSAESADIQRTEILHGKARLESAIGRPVRSFSYPFGTRDAYTARSVKLVRAAGFDRACANYPGSIGPATDHFRLPRFIVRDWPLDEFKRRVADFLVGQTFLSALGRRHNTPG